MGDYKLSVVVLVYNTEQYLRDCIDSLVNQTLKDIEIILVNDESPDNSLLILEEYERNYPNIRVLNQKNTGGAIAGNNGLKLTTSKYVTIMDSDDIVPLDAYEKLYKKAIETDADIVIGKANVLVGGAQKEIIYKKERDVWLEERIIDNVREFPDIFYDGFYWNKIYKRALLFDHDCLMPPGMLYADRPMVHKAYLYAKKIAIIKDVVYLWRKREEDAEAKSITQLKTDIHNFQDRITSLNYQIDYFNKFNDQDLKNKFLKRNIDRLFFPISGILVDEEFKSAYLKEIKHLLLEIPGVYDNDLGIIKNLYIYLILNDLTDALIQFLESEKEGPITEEDGKYYWNLPLFRDETYRVPDDLFLIKVLLTQFIKMDSIVSKDDQIVFSSIRVPELFKIDSAQLAFISRIDVDDQLYFDLIGEEGNSFSADVKINSGSETALYDVYLVFNYDGKEERFRINKKMLNEQHSNQENKGRRKLFFTKFHNLSYLTTNLTINHIDINQDGISLSIQKGDERKSSSNVYLENRATKEKIYFHKSEDETTLTLPWKHFVEVNQIYDFYEEVQKQSVRIGETMIPDFKSTSLYSYGLYMDLYKTDKSNISFKTTSKLKKRLLSFIKK